MLFDCEGDYHRTSPAQFRRDIARRERFEAHGWRVVRVTSDDLYVTTPDFVARVRRIIAYCTLDATATPARAQAEPAILANPARARTG